MSNHLILPRTQSMKHRFTKLPHYVYLYFFCQSINLTAAVISVSIVASTGNALSPSGLYATTPYGMQFLFLLIGTHPASMLMKKYGRKAGFSLGAVLLAFSGVIGYIAVAEKSFLLLILAHAFLGLFTSCANFYRYAVTDALPTSLQPRALSLVVAGGVVAGVLGPTLSSYLWNIAGFPRFSLCYAAFTLFALINLVLIYFLPGAQTQNVHHSHPIKQADKKYLKVLLVAICAAAFSYGLMNLLMIQSSLKMDHLQIAFEDAALSIQWHVVAMFLPSFFTGALISRFGSTPIISSGFMLFIFSFLINIQWMSYFSISLSLILLGLAWNFTFVGGSTLLTSALAHSPERQKWQGIGDTVIAVFATIGAVSPSFLLNGIGWENSNILALASCAFPLLGLLWLRMNQTQGTPLQ